MNTKAKKWVELFDWQILAIEEALTRDLPCMDKPSLEALRNLIHVCKQIKVR